MILQVPGTWAIAVNIAAWLVIHVVVSVSIARVALKSFNPRSWLYRQRTWEKGGRPYKSLLKVKRWKRLLPDGAAVFKAGFRKKRLAGRDAAYVQTFILEACRAELTHWIILAFSAVFFIWNEWWIGLIMIAYGLVANMPCIVAQRYNRIKLTRIYARYERRRRKSLAET
jgi:glycosyl-4,4'-diaponeurosporenoate acyltransferase